MNNDTQQPSSEIKVELDAAIQRSNDLRTLIHNNRVQVKELMEECAKMEKELHNLVGGQYAWGRITGIKNRYNSAVNREEDMSRTRVVWVDSRDYSKTPPKEDWVVVKVTEKRILIRRIDDGHTEQYDRFSGCMPYGYTRPEIDIPATFGVAIPPLTVAQKKSKPKKETSNG